MATDAAAPRSGRPRPWLLVLLGILVVGYLASQMFSGGTATPTVPTTTPQRAANAQKPGQVSPADLDVKIEALKPTQAPAEEGDRNPFRFQPKAPPPPPPAPPASKKPVTVQQPPPVDTTPPPPPQPPPIGNTIKFIGIVDTGKTKIGAFSDCRATFPGREGDIIEGRFRVVRIGVESAVLEYADGKGRTTLPLNGQACVGK